MFAFPCTQNLHRPVHGLGIFRVHAEQVTGKNSRFVATGAGADLQVNIAVVVPVRRDQVFLQFELQRILLFAERCQFLLPHLTHFRVPVLGHLFGRGDVIGQGLVLPEQANHRIQAGVFLRQVTVRILIPDDLRVRQEALELLEALARRFQFAPYRFFQFSSLSLLSRSNSFRAASIRPLSEDSPASRR